MRKTFFALFLILSLLLTVRFVSAQSTSTNCDPHTGYCLLAPLPLGDNKTVVNQVQVGGYIENTVKLVIGLASAAAVLMIIYGGFQYILSAIPSVKQDGKQIINNALIGLILIIASYTILYTLNPNLVKFNLSLVDIKDSNFNSGLGNGVLTSGAASGANNCGNGCKDAYTYGFPKKGTNGGACTGNVCYIDPALANDLVSLNSMLGSSNWTVTEMTPPTVNHADYCHSNGTCVDATLTNPTVDEIATLFTDLDKLSGGLAGFSSYEYEVCDQTMLAQLQSNPKLKPWQSKIKCEDTTQNGSSGQSMHLEGPNANNKNFGAVATTTSS